MYNANFFCETLEKGRIFWSKQRLRAWERERMKGRKKNEHVFTFILIHRFLGQFASFHVYSIGKLFITYISLNSPHSAVSSPVQTRHTPIYIITWHWFFCSCLEPEKNHTNFPDRKAIFLCVCAMQMRDKCLIGVNRSLSIFDRRKNRLRICVLCGPIKTQNLSKIREFEKISPLPTQYTKSCFFFHSTRNFLITWVTSEISRFHSFTFHSTLNAYFDFSFLMEKFAKWKVIFISPGNENQNHFFCWRHDKQKIHEVSDRTRVAFLFKRHAYTNMYISMIAIAMKNEFIGAPSW